MSTPLPLSPAPAMPNPASPATGGGKGPLDAAHAPGPAVTEAAARWAWLGFPLVALRFEAVAQDTYLTPAFAGSVLRGSFGHALRRLVCMTGLPACDGCALLDRCPYPAIFMPPSSTGLAARGMQEPPVAYAFAPPPFGRSQIVPGEPLVFGVTLFGPATRRVAHVVETMRRALARGLGQKRARFALTRVSALVDPFDAVFTSAAAPALVPLYDFVDETTETLPVEAAVLDGAGLSTLLARRLGALPAAPCRLTLHHDTPLRLKRRGRILDHRSLVPADILIASWRRRQQLDAVCGDPATTLPPLGEARLRPDAIPVLRRVLDWTDWTRRSSRQRRTMTIGGVRGNWSWSLGAADMHDLLALLATGALLHIGKETSFGFGHIRLLAEADSRHPEELPGLDRR